MKNILLQQRGIKKTLLMNFNKLKFNEGEGGKSLQDI